LDCLNNLDSDYEKFDLHNLSEKIWLSLDYIKNLTLDIINFIPSFKIIHLDSGDRKVEDLDLITNLYKNLDFSKIPFGQITNTYDNPVEVLIHCIYYLILLGLIFSIILSIDLIILYLIKSDKINK
jgi:hypothetical protein